MSQKTSSVMAYTFVFLALLALLGLTLVLSLVDLRGFNTVVSLAIAVLKAALVALYFMHLEKSAGLHRVFSAVGVFWLGILATLAIADYLSRGWMPLPGAWPQW